MTDIPANERILLAFDADDYLPSDGEFISRIIGKVGGIKVGSVPMHARLKADYRITIASAVGSHLKNFHPDSCRMDDPKMFEIPSVMAGAARCIAASGAWGFTVHEANSDEALSAAIKNCGESLVIGVGVLTSFNKRDSVRSYGEVPDVKMIDFAERFAELGGHAQVCSGHELECLQSGRRRDLIKIVPGIRDDGAPADDQARTMTAYEAIVRGADYLVIGRPIMEAKDPEAAIDRFVAQIEKGILHRH
ncbi:MAG: orotidine 5'-phosphate decarboxylase / HUMPS family protein [Patescibacteria group bacterium]